MQYFNKYFYMFESKNTSPVEKSSSEEAAVLSSNRYKSLKSEQIGRKILQREILNEKL